MHQTEFPFTLPHGYLDGEGILHREGVMRLSRAADEITPLRDPRVQRNSGYLVIILLARVIVRLGTIESLNTKIIEDLFSAISPIYKTSTSRLTTMGIPGSGWLVLIVTASLKWKQNPWGSSLLPPPSVCLRRWLISLIISTGLTTM